MQDVMKKSAEQINLEFYMIKINKFLKTYLKKPKMCSVLGGRVV